MIKLKIKYMTCTHCAEIITRVIHETAPHARVEVDLPQQLIYVEGTNDLALLKRAIREVGYTPVLQQ